MITSKEDAIRTARWGSYACFAVTVFTTLVVGVNASLSKPAVPWLKANALVDAVLFLALGIWMWKMSKAASVIALASYAVEIAWKWDAAGKAAFSAAQILWTCLYIAAFVQGVRGTYAFDALNKAEAKNEIVQAP